MHIPTSRVLNAFRHHGLYRRRCRPAASTGRLSCSTPFGITDYIGYDPAGYEAQSWVVLNAFRHHGLYRSAHRPPDPAPPEGAQRLSASRIISGVVTVPSLRERRVLNAFRHHGLYRPPAACMEAVVPPVCSTPFGITDYIGFPGSAISSRGSRCSTPFGITDYIGRGRPRAAGARVFRRVLNAFRHHGLYRHPAALGGVRHGLGRCSTPFGITDYIGSSIVCAAISAQRCSTPFGITDYIGPGRTCRPCPA